MNQGKRGDSLLVRNARLWPHAAQTQPVCVRIVDGVIREVEAELPSGSARVLDAQGLSLIPGLVDVHVHFRDPGLERKEGWDHGSQGALHGGVTSVVEVQNNPPLSTTLEALSARLEHVRSRSRVDFGCLANLLPESMPELAAMAPLTPAFKCFLGGSTGLGGQTDVAALREQFAAAARAGQHRYGLRALVLVGPSEVELGERIARDGGALCLSQPVLPLDKLKALVARGTVMVTGDTGPRHLGVAYDLPVVCLIGPTDPAYTNYCLDRTILIRKDLPCVPCQRKVCPLGHHRCMRDITVDEVVDAVGRLVPAVAR